MPTRVSWGLLEDIEMHRRQQLTWMEPAAGSEPAVYTPLQLTDPGLPSKARHVPCAKEGMETERTGVSGGKEIQTHAEDRRGHSPRRFSLPLPSLNFLVLCSP